MTGAIDPLAMTDKELIDFYDGLTLKKQSREPKNAGQEMNAILSSLTSFATSGEMLGVVEMKPTAVIEEPGRG